MTTSNTKYVSFKIQMSKWVLSIAGEKKRMSVSKKFKNSRPLVHTGSMQQWNGQPLGSRHCFLLSNKYTEAQCLDIASLSILCIMLLVVYEI